MPFLSYDLGNYALDVLPLSEMPIDHQWNIPAECNPIHLFSAPVESTTIAMESSELSGI
jgi:hypothetical protein